MATLDYQIGNLADDVMWYATTFDSLGSAFGRHTSGVIKSSWRFTGVTIPAGATITAAYLSFYYYDTVGTPPACALYAEDAANPGRITTYGDGNGRSLTTASISITCPSSGTWWNSSSLVNIIQELVDSYSYVSGAAMQFIVVGGGATGTNYGYCYDYEDNSSRAAKLHIEYEVSGDPEGSLLGGKLIRGGLLLHGVLGR